MHREKRDREGRELETLRHGLLTTPHYYHLDMGDGGEGGQGRGDVGRRGENWSIGEGREREGVGNDRKGIGG